MKAISTSLLKTLNSQTPSYIKKIVLFPKIWKEASLKYIFSEGVDITPRILEISPIKWKLDTEGYGVWNSASVSLTLSNADGFFGPSLIGGLLEGGKILYSARADFYGGANTEEAQEYLKLFRGCVLSEPFYNDKEKTLTLYFNGELSLLKNFPAEEISINSPAENLLKDYEDASVFYTNQKNAGRVSSVYKIPADANQEPVLLKPEYDYKVSSLNNYDEPAKIQLSAPLDEGESCRADCRYWHKNKTPDWIAQAAASLCGAEQTAIEPMLFIGGEEYSVKNNFRQPTVKSFNEGVFLHTEVFDNIIKLQSVFPTPFGGQWSIDSQPQGVNFKTLKSDDIEISLNNSSSFSGACIVSAPADNAYGTWEACVHTVNGQEHRTWFHFISETGPSGFVQGYAVSLYQYNSRYLFIRLYRVADNLATLIGEKSVSFNATFSEVKYRITRNAEGNFYCWIATATPASDWQYLGFICKDTTYTVNKFLMVLMQLSVPNRIRDIKSSSLVATGSGNYAPSGIYYSPVIDGGSALINWQNFYCSADTPQNTSAVLKYRSKEEEESLWTPWALIADGDIPPTQNRYLQLMWQAVSDTEQSLTPALNWWKISSTSKSIVIASVNSGGLSCYDLMREIAQMTGWQIGYDSEGVFLFKPRSFGAPKAVLDSNSIIEVESANTNADKIYNRLSVSYGNYASVEDSFTQNEPRPNLIDKYGVRAISLSSGNLLLPQSSDIAAACAKLIYKSVSKVKKQAVIIIKFMPHIELDDILTVNYPPLLNFTARVEGIEINLSSWTMRLELTEV